MLTKDQITEKGIMYAEKKDEPRAVAVFAAVDFVHGAIWANNQNAAEIAEKNTQIKELVEVLRALYDVQNGAPLAADKHQKHWQAAYANAGEILKKYEQ